MKSSICFLIAFAALAANQQAQAAVKGQCLYEGKTISFVDGHAGMGVDPFEENQKVPMLWLTSAPMDHAALESARFDEIDDVVTSQVFEKNATKLELRFGADGKLVEGLQLYVPPGNNRSLSGNDVGKLQLKAPLTVRANGQFILDDDEDLKCNVQFDLPMSGKGPAPVIKAWGTALPEGGGEPGKIYLALHRATLSGDVEKMLSLVTKDKAEKMREARKQPEFSKMLDMIKAFEPAQTRVLSGRVDGERAELQIDGKESDGAVMTGTVKLVREAGRWVVENVSTKSKM